MGIVLPFSQTWTDYPDPISNAVLIYFTGCCHNCKDCHNSNLQHYGDFEINSEEIITQIKSELKKNRTNKVVLSGGDPLHPLNINITKKILEQDFDTCIYTGYDFSYVKENSIRGFKFIKCGKYDKDLKQESRKTDDYISFGSTNQELYNQYFNLISKDGKHTFEGAGND